ncbi:ABC transporter ATP-binding protein [Acetatifactor aquisgranensis]|uniref:ABC transporter ATP-binding protein n=1 Tax=Acetatifactor aquisgranensis TaxID=2941233 RepID=UPI00203DD57B|nr:ABC transporter ATP-binding protein [Acetatifactor aquisgranensis]
MAMLEISQITKRYKDKLALDQVSLALEPGVYGLLGPNGAGKSTLMNIISGNLRPTGGQVRWEGKEIRALGAAYRSLLGYAPQQQGMYEHFSGIRFLSYMAALKGIPGKEQPAELERVLRFVNLWDERKRPVSAYSGGMKQRVLIAQAVLGNPRCVILDEPTAGLDPRERVRIREQIRALSGDRIILVSTHVVSDIEPIAAEILLLKAGRLVDRGSVEALCGKYGGAKGLEEVYLQIFGEEERHVSSDGL